MRVIGTAGHVDHGKSSLVTALTGIDPDRLKEEQEREMTIDLGFAWMTLPSGQEVGIIDVPGHRDFIENMLAGVGGIDAALLVIAADEGIMPQTKEHLSILDLLEVPAGIVALNKIDLVDDSEWISLVTSDIRKALQGTLLQDAPIIPVSAHTGSGIPELIQALDNLLSNKNIPSMLPSRLDRGRPRLPIDRVFTITGFGTVVTGTLVDGSFSIGEEVEILPSRQRARIRGLQTHKKNSTNAISGSRVAVNLTGMDVDAIHRGDLVTHPSQYTASRRLDVQVRLLPDIHSPLSHGDEVKFFTGTTETLARARVLGSESLGSGQSGWLQLELRTPVVCERSDRFIIRRPSPGETIGGGRVVDPQPHRRHKRQDQTVILALETMVLGSPAEMLLQTCLTYGPSTEKDLALHSKLDLSTIHQTLSELVSSGQFLRLEEYYLTPSQSVSLEHSINETMLSYHKQNPLRWGISREELKSRLNIPARIFNLIIHKLAADRCLSETGALVASATHTVSFTPRQQEKIHNLMAQFKANPHSPPTIKECQEMVGEDVFSALIDTGKLTRVSMDVAFQQQDLDQIIEKVKQTIAQKGQITLAEVRDLLKTSRRYAQAVLEYMDTAGITIREIDIHRLAR